MMRIENSSDDNYPNQSSFLQNSADQPKTHFTNSFNVTASHFGNYNYNVPSTAAYTNN